MSNTNEKEQLNKDSEIKFKGKYFEAVGRRKRAIARARLYNGKGDMVVNNNKIVNPNPVAIMPLVLLSKDKNFDVSIKVSGGGITSQEEAIRHAISRALIKYDQNLKPTLRKAGYLTRDPREKERKKPGLRGARRAPQWQKR